MGSWGFSRAAIWIKPIFLCRSPPPLPPHGIPAEKQQQSTEQSGNDVEYKPPVPPHRNMGVTARIGPSLQAPGPQPGFQQPPPPPPAAGSPLPARRHHHHHHHHRNSSRGGGDSNQQQQTQPPPPPPPSSRQHKRRQQQQHGGGEFVAAQSGPPEVKRATIVGNPMFSANAATGGGNGEELMGLDDLNLGMDYDQIMEYFDNLKESNAWNEAAPSGEKAKTKSSQRRVERKRKRKRIGEE